jgi:predicted solute-binding protein
MSAEPDPLFSPSETPYRVAVAHRLDTLPLTGAIPQVEGLEAHYVPASRLLEALQTGHVHAALLSAADVLRLRREFEILPASCVATRGATASARVFCQKPPAEIGTIFVAHPQEVSSLLTRIVWAEQFGRDVRLIALDPASDLRPEAMLIGTDEPYCPRPEDYPHAVEVGRLWFEITGLPMVWFVWVAPASRETDELCQRLCRAHRMSLEHLEELLDEQATAMGWPAEEAREHLHHEQQYRFTQEHADGLIEFASRAVENDLVPTPPRVQFHRP